MGTILFGLTLAQWLVLIPEIWAAIKTASEIYRTLTDKDNVPKEEAVGKSFTLLGKALGKLAYDALAMSVPLPHRMTPEEEELWFNRASGIPG